MSLNTETIWQWLIKDKDKKTCNRSQILAN